MKCKLFTTTIGKKVYQVFIGYEKRIKCIYVHRRKDIYFVIAPKTKMQILGSDLVCIDRMGYKVTYEGIDRNLLSTEHEIKLNFFLKDYAPLEAVSIIEKPNGIRKSSFENWKQSVINAINEFNN